jgi:hypothetical protein
MIEQVGQGRMRAAQEQATGWVTRSAGLIALVLATSPLLAVETASGASGARQKTAQPDARQIEQTQREEGQAILSLADAVMAGKAVASDFSIAWENDFVKAQRGTFVPFTLTVDGSALTRPAALVYVRAVQRSAGAETGKRARPSRSPDRDEAAYPVDAIFPVELATRAGQSRISRGFSVPPGEYDVLVVMRERVEPGASRVRPKVAVVRHPLIVPDFGSNELMTSSVMVADRLRVLTEPVPADQLPERPYVIGRNEISPAADRQFRRDEELIVVFLVYNPMVTPERQFDVRVEYHFFRKAASGTVAASPLQAGQPVPRSGEQYFNRTDPQRFNPALMGAGFDPGTGEPVMAGQVVPLAGFEVGDYRLQVEVMDLLSGKSISRDVLFTVSP